MDTPSRGLLWPTTTPTPDTLLDYWLPRLTGAQLRVLLFLVRETYGFRQPDATVNLSTPQFLQGKRRDVRAVCGCGLRSKTSLRRALHELEDLGLVYRRHPEAGEPADASCSYRLLITRHPVTPESEGFRPSSTTALPDAIFDIWLERLGDAELRVLLYIARHTLGWRKDIDVIGIRQFMHGISTKDGRIVDEGCGVKTEKFIYQALAGLEEYGLITRLRRFRKDGGHLTTAYSLRFAGDRPTLPPRPARATPDDALTLDSQQVRSSDTCGERPENGGAVVTGEGGQFASERGDTYDGTCPSVATGEGRHSQPGPTVIDNGRGGVTTTGRQQTRRQQTQCQQPQRQQIYVSNRAPVAAQAELAASPLDSRDSIAEAGEKDQGSTASSTGLTVLADYAANLSRDLGDEHPSATLTRLVRLKQEHGVDEASFIALAETAWATTRAAWPSITRRTRAGETNGIPFFLATMSGLLADASPESDGECAAPAPEPRGAGTMGEVDDFGDPAWAAICAEMRETITAENYARWLAPTRARLTDDGVRLVVTVPDEFHRRWCDQRLRGAFERAARMRGVAPIITFVVEGKGGDDLIA